MDEAEAPHFGEIRISDTQVQGFGLRLWAGPNGGGRAFDLRAKNANGGYSRKVFKPWQDARPSLWEHEDLTPFAQSLGPWLTLAREWAVDERYRLLGKATPEERRWAIHRAKRAGNEQIPLGEQITDMLENGKARGWSERFRDSILQVAGDLPAELTETPLGDVDPETYCIALAQLPHTRYRIGQLREFISRMVQDETLANAGLQLQARRLTNEFKHAMAAHWSPNFDRKLDQYPPFIEPVLRALENDEVNWVQSMALQLYLRLDVPQSAILKAEWRQFYEGVFYPYMPSEREHFYLKGRALLPFLAEKFDTYRARVDRCFGSTKYVFPNAALTSHQSSLQRGFQRALQSANWPSDQPKVQLRQFAVISKKAYSFQRLRDDQNRR